MKTKKSILNFITEIVPIVLVIILGLYKSKLMIRNVNTNEVGLYQLYSQLLGYATIFEFGMTGALLYRLFKPVTEKDQMRLNILFSSGKKVFRVISYAVIGVSIMFTFFIPLLIKDNPFNYHYILATFLMYISTNVIYYYVVSYKLILEAEEKKYIVNIIVQGAEVLKSIIEIIAIILFKNLYAILTVGIITTIISSVLLIVVCKKYNPELKVVEERDYEMVSDVKHLVVHKFAYLINNNIDLLIITRILGLSSVVVYSMYNYIVNSLKKVTSRIYLSIVPSLGNLLIEDKERAKTVFYELNDFMFFVAMIITTTLTVSINQFIDIWYSEQIYTSYLYGLGFSLILYVSIIIQPMLAYTDAGGCFKETKICAVMEACINLVLSLIFVHIWGIFGILIATFLGYIISDNIVRSKIICKKLLNDSSNKYYKDFIIYGCITASLIIVEYFIFKDISYLNIQMWFIGSLVTFVANLVCLLGIYILLNKVQILIRLKKVFVDKLKRKVI